MGRRHTTSSRGFSIVIMSIWPYLQQNIAEERLEQTIIESFDLVSQKLLTLDRQGWE